MALQPVSSITPSRAYNVNFGARNYDNISEGSPRRNYTELKAVPIAVLIAMSPLNSVDTYAGNGEISGAAPIELVENSEQPQPKIINSVDLKDKQGRVLYTLNQLSTDDNNSNFEGLEVIRYEHIGKTKISHRALIRHAFIGKDADNQEITRIAGYNLDTQDLNNYKKRGGIFRRRLAYEGEFLQPASEAAAKKQLDEYLIKWANSEKNNGAFKMYDELRKFSYYSNKDR